MPETKKSNKCFLIGGFIFSGNPEAACEGHFLQKRVATAHGKLDDPCQVISYLQHVLLYVYEKKGKVLQ